MFTQMCPTECVNNLCISMRFAMKAVFYVLPFVIALSTSVLCDNTTCVTIGVPHETNRSTVDYIRGASESSNETQTNNAVLDKDENQYEYQANVRNRRSSHGLMRFFKSLFVKPKDTPEVKPDTFIITPINDTKVKSATNIRRSNFNYNDIEKKGIESVLYKLDLTLNKMARALSSLTDSINLSTVGVPIYRSKREISDVSVLKLNNSDNVTKSNISDNVTEINDNNGTEKDNTRRTYSVNEFEFINTNGNASDVINNSEMNHPSDSQESRNIEFTYRIHQNVTKEKQNNNVTNVGNNSDNVTNLSNKNGRRSEGSDLLFKTAVRNIENQIEKIKSHRILSEESYKMGFVVSSLETLESTLKKILKRMTLERDGEWVRKMSAKIALSNRIVNNLMNHLRVHNMSR